MRLSCKPQWLLVPLLLTSLTCLPLRAQTYDLGQHREVIGDLSQVQWRFHTGDNPQWADPAFDDSQWPLIKADRGWAEQGYAGYHGYAWYRLHVHLPEPNMAIALAPVHLESAYRLYWNGRLLGGVGGMEPKSALLHKPYGFYQTVAHSTDAVIAIRVWQPAWGAPYGVGGFHRTGDLLYGFSSRGGFLIGAPSIVRQLNDSRISRVTEQGTAQIALAVLIILAGLLSLLLWWRQRGNTEYLWFALFAFCAPWQHSLLYAIFPRVALNHSWLAVGDDLIEGVGVLIFGVLFVYRFLRQPLTRIIRAALWLGVAAEVFEFLADAYLVRDNLMSVATKDALGWLPIALWYALTYSVMLRNWRNRDARWLLVPWIIVSLQTFGNFVLIVTYTAGWQHSLAILPAAVQRPFPITITEIGRFLFLLIMAWILVDRFANTSDRQAQQQSEIEAAKEVQGLLIPTAVPNTPGFAVESVYLPASEVGGDFFHVQPGNDGSLLIVVGDVSGKGLKAAMTVSTIVGALRNEPSREPTEILDHLNRVLHGQIKGFATCCAALIAGDGAMSIANAGHIPPYRNGETLSVDSNLPLGIIADTSYMQTMLQLAAGDSLTFVSDGVIEATNAKRELFGFERTQAISKGGANTIATAAQAFGQIDDISVLTVQFSVPVLA